MAKSTIINLMGHVSRAGTPQMRKTSKTDNSTQDAPLKHIISWSGGKDSTATVILAHEHNLPVDEIIFCEVMYDHIRGISGELPEHIDFIKNVAIPKFEEWGYKVTIVHDDKDFLDLFYHRIQSKNSKHKGLMHGYMIAGRCLANKSLKVGPLRRYIKNIGGGEYLGIASDEPERLARLVSPKQRSLLAEFNLTEKDAYDLCAKYSLLSPIYTIGNRWGCWFCPNAPIAQYAYLKQKNPELYEEFIRLGDTPLMASDKFRFEETTRDLGKKVNQYIENERNQLTFDL